MAGLSYSITDNEVRTVWENDLDREIRAMDPILDPENGLAGEGRNSLVIQRDELGQQGGGTLRIKFRYQLKGRGRAGDEVLRGHEEGYETSTFDLKVNTLRHAFAVSSPIQDQWISEDAMEEGIDGLSDWGAKRLGLALHLHATGVSAVTDDAYRLHNTVNALNSSYILRPNDKAAGALTESDSFDIDQLNRVARFVRMVRPKIRPAQTPWGPKYCVFISPEQRESLRKSDSQWYGAMTAALQGGNMKSGVFTQALGSFDNFLLFESDLVPPGLNSGETALKANTRRAWVGGAGALTMVFGRGYKVSPVYTPNRWKWVKESEDYDHQHSIAVNTIVGVARPRFTRPSEGTARENGVVVIETYADLDGMSSADAYEDWTDMGLTIEA